MHVQTLLSIPVPRPETPFSEGQKRLLLLSEKLYIDVLEMEVISEIAFNVIDSYSPAVTTYSKNLRFPAPCFESALLSWLVGTP